MTTKHRSFLFVLLALSLIVLPTVLVSAKEISFLTIRGPGIKGEIMLNEPEAMRRLLESGFLFGEYSAAPKPDDPVEGYRIFAYLYLDGPTVPFVELTYYPPLVGQDGLIHYTARLGSGGTNLEQVDDWRRVPNTVASEVSTVFDSQGVTLQPVDFSNSGQVGTPKSTGEIQKEPGSLQSSWTGWVWTAVWIPIVVLIGVILKKLTLKYRPAPGN